MTMNEILESILASIDRGEAVAVATIVTGSGSLPMSRRSKMVVREDGTQIGTVGGGCVEAEVHAMAVQCLRSGRAALRRFTLTEAKAGAEGLNCGGTVEILIEPHPDPSFHRRVLEALERRDELVLVTLVAGTDESPRIAGKGAAGWKGWRMTTGLLAAAGAALLSFLEEEAQSILGGDTCRKVALPPETAGGPAGAGWALLETLCAPPTLYLFGGGHVSLAVARVARTAGFRIVVVDDRAAFANPGRFPEADETLVLPMESAFSRLPIDSNSYIVAVTRGHQHDEPVIEQAVRTPAAYIGMLGSRRKVAIMWERLKARGVSEEMLARVRAPIGVPIGADGPGEIAVSIVAQLIETRRGREGRVSGRREPAGAP
jgi:xanthine dehydrogenase accessory factor